MANKTTKSPKSKVKGTTTAARKVGKSSTRKATARKATAKKTIRKVTARKAAAKMTTSKTAARKGAAKTETPPLGYRRKYGGLIGIESKVPIKDKHALSVIYTPGVGSPCMEIFHERKKSFEYTCRGNTIAVLTDGSAVFGLGNVGARAALPVMEAKSVIFKTLAGIDAFPICVDTNDPEEIVRVGLHPAPTFGGISLEDISAPRCFNIEEQLSRGTTIPVFHTDQHGAPSRYWRRSRSAIETGQARVKVDPDKVAARTREYVYEGRLVPLE